MNWVSVIFSAFKAIPDIVQGIKLINENIIKIGDARTEAKIDSIKGEMDEALARIKKTEDRKELLDLVERLNKLRV